MACPGRRQGLKHEASLQEPVRLEVPASPYSKCLGCSVLKIFSHVILTVFPDEQRKQIKCLGKIGSHNRLRIDEGKVAVVCLDGGVSVRLWLDEIEVVRRCGIIKSVRRRERLLQRTWWGVGGNSPCEKAPRR